MFPAVGFIEICSVTYGGYGAIPGLPVPFLPLKRSKGTFLPLKRSKGTFIRLKRKFFKGIYCIPLYVFFF